MCKEKEKPKSKIPADGKSLTETNGDKHNLLPDNETWIEDAKNDMEEYIELNGIHIRQ